MDTFAPDYTHILDAANNREAKRLPLYEHIVCDKVLGEACGGTLETPEASAGLRAYFSTVCSYFVRLGYDIIPHEEVITGILPGGGALANSATPPAIRDRADFERYPWDELPALYFEANTARFEALESSLPPGMKAVGGVGNGVFEIAQDLTGYENLCYLAYDDPELYADLFRKAGDVMAAIWERFLARYADAYCVMRMGDDLGYKSNTLLPTQDILTHIVPQYRRLIALVHGAGAPFLLHSCGNIFSVMDALVDAGIDAKHSNEDQIAPFPEWVRWYGDKIGNFGGIDTDAVCRLDRTEMREYIADVVRQCTGHGGFAFGSGNSIPEYVPAGQFLMMNEIVRELRGEKPAAGYSAGGVL